MKNKKGDAFSHFKNYNYGLPKSKKAAEMTIGTIIVIILALVVLVVIVYGFTTGWGNLWQKLLGYGGGTVNVQTVVDGCKLACTTNSVYDYCVKYQKVTFDTNASSDMNKRTYTCKMLESYNVGLVACDNVDCSGQIKGTGKCSAWQGVMKPIGTCGNSNQFSEVSSLSGAEYTPGYTCCVPRKACKDWTGSQEAPIASACPEGFMSSKTDNINFALTPASITDLNTRQVQCCIK